MNLIRAQVGYPMDFQTYGGSFMYHWGCIRLAILRSTPLFIFVVITKSPLATLLVSITRIPIFLLTRNSRDLNITLLGLNILKVIRPLL